MNKKIAACYVATVVLLIANMVGAEVISSHLLTKDPMQGSGCDTPVASSTFSPLDERAYSWLLIYDIVEGDVVKWQWHAPDESLYFEDTNVMSFTGDGCTWNDLFIRGEGPAGMPGEWRVDVFYNDDFQYTENFTIAAGACAIRQLYGTDAEETRLLRSFRDHVLNATPEGREMVKLYYQWSPALVRSMEGDDELRDTVKAMVDRMLPLTGLQ